MHEQVQEPEEALPMTAGPGHPGPGDGGKEPAL